MSRQGTAEATPALYDTSISTTESTSYSSNNYGYFPHSRPHQSQQQQHHHQLSAYNSVARNESNTDPTAASWNSAPLPSKMVSAASRLTSQQRYRPERTDQSLERVDEAHPRAQSEPGAYSPEHDRFAAYIDRLADLEARREQRIKKSQSAEEKKEDHLEKRRGNGHVVVVTPQQYPDPEPTVAEMDDEDDPHQHLPAFETAPSGSRTRDLAKRFESRMYKKSTLIQGAHLAHQHSSPETRREEQQRARSRSPHSRHSFDERSQNSSIAGRKSHSSHYSYGDRTDEHSRRSANNEQGVRRRRPLQEPAPTNPTERDLMMEQQQQQRPASPSKSDIPPSYMERVEIETPCPARVRDLQEKLWDHSESLRTSRAEQQERRRNTRSLSPRNKPLEERKMFKSRYYEAAAAAQRTTPSSPSQSASTAGKTSRTSYDRRGDRSYKSRESSSSKPRRTREEGKRTPVEQMDYSSKQESDVNAAALVARLSAIDRSNPQAALAQIDAILKQESISSSKDYTNRKAREENRAAAHRHQEKPRREAHTSPTGRTDEEQESSEGETDDETSVSSITNPTFQAHKAERALEAKASMPASGRPRPSSLQHYAAAPHSSKVASAGENVSPKHVVDSKALKEKSKRKSRRDKDRPPPPATIQVSSSKDKGSKEKAAASKDRGPDAEKERSTTPTTQPMLDSMVQAVDKFLTPTPDQHIDEDGKLVATNSTELAQKIRRWDEMSGPGSIPNAFTSESHGNTNPFEERKSTNPFDDHRGTNPFEDRSSKNRFEGPKSPNPFDEEPTPRDTTPNRNRRPHPWDSSMPVRSGRVETRETSMDNATGVEVEYSPKYGDDMERPSAVPSQHLSSRSMRKERISREMQSTRSKESSEGDQFEVDPKLLKQKDSWEVGPSRFPRQQQEYSKTLSDHYDEAWVAVPSSTYFPEKDEQSKEDEKRQHGGRDARESDSRPYRAPVRRDAPVQTISPRTEVASGRRPSRRYVPPDPETKYKGRQATAYDEGPIDRKDSKEESDEQGAVEIALVEEPSPEKSRRKFRSLMKRRGNGKGNTTSQSSVGSGSQPLKSQPLLGTQAMDTQTSGGVPSDRGRRRTDSKSPSRDRARSLDERRIRNPSIARKFSRMIRVYDEDKRAQRAHI